jgi:hypothetical protein
VRRFFPGVVNFLVTGLAGFRSHVLGRIGCRGRRDGRGSGLSAFSRSWLASLAGSQEDVDENE